MCKRDESGEEKKRRKVVTYLAEDSDVGLSGILAIFFCELSSCIASFILCFVS